MDTLANAMNSLKVAENAGRPKAFVKPASKTIRQVLAMMQEEGYVGDFEFVDDGRGGQFIVELLGKINNCGAIKPQFAVKAESWEKYEQRYLPGKGLGTIIVTTSQGVMSHPKAKEKGIGGKLLAFIY